MGPRDTTARRQIALEAVEKGNLRFPGKRTPLRGLRPVLCLSRRSALHQQCGARSDVHSSERERLLGKFKGVVSLKRRTRQWPAAFPSERLSVDRVL
jgi:hypothetical protein